MDEVYDVGEFIQKIVEHPAQTEVLEIYYYDLNEEAQEQLFAFYGIKEAEDANLDINPIAILERPEDVQEE